MKYQKIYVVQIFECVCNTTFQKIFARKLCRKRLKEKYWDPSLPISLTFNQIPIDQSVSRTQFTNQGQVDQSAPNSRLRTELKIKLRSTHRLKFPIQTQLQQAGVRSPIRFKLIYQVQVHKPYSNFPIRPKVLHQTTIQQLHLSSLLNSTSSIKLKVTPN